MRRDYLPDMAGGSSDVNLRASDGPSGVTWALLRRLQAWGSVRSNLFKCSNAPDGRAVVGRDPSGYKTDRDSSFRFK